MATIPATARGGDRDFLLHLEAYITRRDGVDKLLKIFRYAAKIVLFTSLSSKALAPRLKAFESSVGLNRKAFCLGKFVQDVNAFRFAAAGCSPSSVDFFLTALAYGGEGLYYFIEQFIWLSKAGLIPSQHLRWFQKISAWAELLGYLGSISLKAKELSRPPLPPFVGLPCLPSCPPFEAPSVYCPGLLTSSASSCPLRLLPRSPPVLEVSTTTTAMVTAMAMVLEVSRSEEGEGGGV